MWSVKTTVYVKEEPASSMSIYYPTTRLILDHFVFVFFGYSLIYI